MKFVTLFLLVILYCDTRQAAKFDFLKQTVAFDNIYKKSDFEKTKLPPAKWFSQILDHYNSSDTQTWKQRYFVNSKYYKKDGPIFLVVTGEWTAQPSFLVDSYVVDLAKNLSAMCLMLEHRYYGMSQPVQNTTNKSININDLVYLSSEQALMDTIYFINDVSSMYNITGGSKWILFGSSYAGSLVTWARYKYPHLVYGAITQSAPLVAKVNYQEFYGLIDNVFKKHSQLCFDTVSSSFKEFYVTFRDPNARRNIEKLFNFCHSFDPNDIVRKLPNVYGWFMNMLVHIVSNTLITVNEACDILLDESLGNSLNKLAALNDILLEQQNLSCFPLGNFDKDSEFSTSNLIRWSYQLCTEFGWFQTTSISPFNVFNETVPVFNYLEECVNNFDSSFLQTLELGVEHTNLLYGGLNIVDKLSNVVFVHGSNDPWFSAGITNTTNPKIIVIIIEGGGHLPLIFPPIQDEQNQTRKTISRIEKIINSWLKRK